MNQSERIELIKAAAMLTQSQISNEIKYQSPEDVMEAFEIFYNYLQVKLEHDSDKSV